MQVSEFNYDLPKELIAQVPIKNRDESRLMVLDRKEKTIEHKTFKDIIDFLEPGDCLVRNNTKVIPARLYGIKEETGAKVEFLLLNRIEGDIWEVMVRPGKKLMPGTKVLFGIKDNNNEENSNETNNDEAYSKQNENNQQINLSEHQNTNQPKVEYLLKAEILEKLESRK